MWTKMEGYNHFELRNYERGYDLKAENGSGELLSIPKRRSRPIGGI